MPNLPSSRGTNSSFLLLKVLVRCRATGRLQGSAAGSCRGRCHPIPGGGLAARVGGRGFWDLRFGGGGRAGVPSHAPAAPANQSLRGDTRPANRPRRPCPADPTRPGGLVGPGGLRGRGGSQGRPAARGELLKCSRLDGTTTAGRDVELC